ncbi:MAG TPA: DUF3237 family protein [Candidatus Dormibacteraeota bacterium]
MHLKPLYSVRFRYPADWSVAMTGEAGREERHFYLAEGTCSGQLRGTFRGANHPRRRTDLTFTPDFQGVIETDDGAVVMFDYQGYGRAYPPGRRQIVTAAWHTTADDRYKWLNDAICVGAGEVRMPDLPRDQVKQMDIELVLDISELMWEPPAD